MLNDNWHIGVDGTPCNCGFGKAYPEAVAKYRERVAKIGSWVVLSATTQEVLEMLPKDFSGKFDNQYPEIKDTILNIMHHVSEEAPDSRWAWRWMVGYLKNITPTLMNNWQQSVAQNRIDFEFPQFFKNEMSYEALNTGNIFTRIKNLKDRYHFKFDLNSYKTFKDIEIAHRKIEEECEEKEEYRRIKDEFKKRQALDQGWTSPVEYAETDSKSNKWFVMPVNEKEAELEGMLMRHCIGSPEQSHIHGIEQGKIKAYSVRDKEGIPWATFTLDKFGQLVHECYGRNDHPVRDPEQKIIENFLKEKFPEAAVDYMKKPEGRRTGFYNTTPDYGQFGLQSFEAYHPIEEGGLSLPHVNYPQELPDLCEWLDQVESQGLDGYLDENLFEGWSDEGDILDNDDGEGQYYYIYQGMQWGVHQPHLIEIGKQLENLAEQTDLSNDQRRLEIIDMIKGFCIAKQLLILESPSNFIAPLEFSIPFFQDVYNMYQETSDFTDINYLYPSKADEVAQSENPIGQETSGTQNLSSEDWQQILQASENFLGWGRNTQGISPDFIDYLREMAKKTDRQSNVNLLLSLKQDSDPTQIENFLNLVRERAGQSQQESIKPMQGQQELFTQNEDFEQKSPWVLNTGLQTGMVTASTKWSYSGGPNPTEADRQAITTINPNVGPLDPKGKTQSPWYPEPDINTDEDTEEDIHNTVMNSESFRNKTRQPTAKWSNEDSVFVDEVFSYLKENKAVVQAYHALAPLGDIYVVGDVPRDVLLGKAPRSIELVAEIDHNTIDYMLNQIPDARVRPDRHSFNFDLNNDSVRVSTINDKDFTADSLMIDLKTGEIIDPSGAMMDINQGVLHHVNPEVFADDPTKMLKALSMYSDHALRPSDEMKIAMAKNAHLLGSLPEDEIRETLDGILRGKRPAETIRFAEDAGLLQHLIPELSQCFGFDLDKPNQVNDLGTHLLDVLQDVSAQTSNENARLAALLHDIAKPKVRKVKNNGQVYYPDHPAVGARIAENIMKRLRYPADRINYVTSLIYHHKFNDFNSPAGAHHYLSILGDDIDLAYDLLSLRQADREDKVNHGMVSFVVNNMRKVLNDEIKTREIQLDELNINEYDVARTLGIKGEEVHNILQKILERVKEHPQLNTRSELMELVRGMK